MPKPDFHLGRPERYLRFGYFSFVQFDILRFQTLQTFGFGKFKGDEYLSIETGAATLANRWGASGSGDFLSGAPHPCSRTCIQDQATGRGNVLDTIVNLSLVESL